MNYLDITLAMYRRGETTDYMIEKEIGKYLDGVVHISKSKSASTSFGIFMVPGKDYTSTEYFIDIAKLTSVYTDAEIVEIFNKILERKIKFMRAIYKFSADNREVDKSHNALMGLLLSLYSTYKSVLANKTLNWLPLDEDILKYADLFSAGQPDENTLEKMEIDGYIPLELSTYIKENLAQAGNITFVNSDKDLPISNFYFRAAIDNCTSTFGIRNHKNIPHNYLPKTNQ